MSLASAIESAWLFQAWCPWEQLYAYWQVMCTCNELFLLSPELCLRPAPAIAPETRSTNVFLPTVQPLQTTKPFCQKALIADSTASRVRSAVMQQGSLKAMDPARSGMHQPHTPNQWRMLPARPLGISTRLCSTQSDGQGDRQSA